VPEDRYTSNNIRTKTLEVVEAGRFDIAMNRSIQTIKTHLDAPEIKT
jgi:hypothetical protein